MELENTSISCGVEQMSRLDDLPKNLIKEFAEEVMWNTYEEAPPAFVVFSDAVKFGNGRRLAAYIKRYKLGKVYATQPKKNMNSRNMIQVWTWSVDWPAVVKRTGVEPREERDDRIYW